MAARAAAAAVGATAGGQGWVGLERGAELDEWPALLVKSLEGSSAPSAPPRKPMRSFSASHTTHYRGTDCTN